MKLLLGEILDKALGRNKYIVAPRETISFQGVIDAHDAETRERSGWWVDGVRIKEDRPYLPEDDNGLVTIKAGAYVTHEGVRYLVTRMELRCNEEFETVTRLELIPMPEGG